MTMRIDFAQFAIPHDATSDELRDWINELFTMWANTSDLLAEYQEGGYVKVVRCRDCEHATISTLGICKYCEMWVLPDVDGYGCDSQVNLPLDFFCAYGKRKEGGEWTA